MAIAITMYPSYVAYPANVRAATGVHGQWGCADLQVGDATAGLITWTVKLGDAAGVLIPGRCFLFRSGRVWAPADTANRQGQLKIKGAVASEDAAPIDRYDLQGVPLYKDGDSVIEGDFWPGKNQSSAGVWSIASLLGDLGKRFGWMIPAGGRQIMPELEIQIPNGNTLSYYIALGGFYLDLDPVARPWGLWYGV